MSGSALRPGLIRAEQQEISLLSNAQRQAMLRLLHRHFDGVDENTFHEDLSAKQGVILLKAESEELIGFSTWYFYDERIEGELLRIAYFGDTIVAKDAWNSQALPKAVIRLLMQESARVAPQRLFSLLICSGFRTYRFMPFFCRTYVPQKESDPGLLALRNKLALARFGSQFNKDSGIVQLWRGAYALKKGLAEPDGHVEVDEASAYFFKANPGWDRGDELVCLAEMKDDNLTAVSRHLLKRCA